MNNLDPNNTRGNKMISIRMFEICHKSIHKFQEKFRKLYLAQDSPLSIFSILWIPSF